MTTRIARGIGALALALAAWLPVAATAQQPAAPAPQPAAAAAPQQAASAPAPDWNNPPAWNDVSSKAQYASVPGRETNVLIQGAGHEWRKLRNGPVTFYGGIILLIPLAILVLFYLAKGPIKMHDPLTGRLIERFTSVERVAHWTMATFLRRAGAHRHRDPLRQAHHPADRGARGVLVAHGARQEPAQLRGPALHLRAGDLHHALHQGQLLQVVRRRVARQARRHVLGRARSRRAGSTPARSARSGGWWSGSAR